MLCGNLVRKAADMLEELSLLFQNRARVQTPEVCPMTQD